MKRSHLLKKQKPLFNESRPALSETSPIPLYIQLADLIRSDIIRGKLKRGDVIPTEKELGEFYGVSRITVRNALAKLVEDGLIYRKRGKGTSVKQDKLTRQTPGLFGIHEEIRASGKTPETRLLAFEIVSDPPVEVKKGLILKPGEKTVRVEREVYADRELLGITIAFIPLRIWEKLAIRPENLANHSLYHFLEQGGFKLYEAEETIEVNTAGGKVASQLHVPRGFPLFYLKRTVYTKEGLPIEQGENIFRADRYQFRIHHWRPVNLKK